MYTFHEDRQRSIIDCDDLMFDGWISGKNSQRMIEDTKESCETREIVQRKRKDEELEQIFSKFPEVFCQGLMTAGQCTAGKGDRVDR